jgi:hypothetical protein
MSQSVNVDVQSDTDKEEICEVLLVLKEWRRVVRLNRSKTMNLSDVIENKINDHYDDTLVISGSSKSQSYDGLKYYLQKWSLRWGCYINIDSCDELNDGDRVTIVPRSEAATALSPLCDSSDGKSKLNELGGRASSLVNTVRKQGEASVTELRKLFPSSSKAMFPPVAKDGLGKTPRKLKPNKISVMMMDSISSPIPKGKARLNIVETDRVKVLDFKRNMSAAQVKQIIQCAFNVEDIEYLLPERNGKKLTYAANQYPTGDELINLTGRKSFLYICEKEEMAHYDQSPVLILDEENPAKKLHTDDSNSIDEILSSIPPVIFNDVSNEVVVVTAEEIMSQPLSNKKTTWEEEYKRAQDVLLMKFTQNTATNEVMISFKFPDSSKINYTFSVDSSSKVSILLYYLIAAMHVFVDPLSICSL